MAGGIKIKIKVSTILLLFYLLLTFSIFILFSRPILVGDVPVDQYVQLYFDSLTYHNFVESIGPNESIQDVLNVSLNYLGPYIILELLANNPILVYFFNFGLFVYSVKKIEKYFPELNYSLFLKLLMISPIMFISILSVNKEIVSLLVMSILIVNLRKKSIVNLVSAIILSMFVRWQMTLFVVIWITINSIKLLKNNFKTTFILMLLLMSIIYPLQVQNFSSIYSSVQSSIEEMTETRGGTYVFLLGIQSHLGGYFLVMFPKTLHLLIGTISNYHSILDFSDFINNDIVFFQNLIYLIMLPILIYKRKFNGDLIKMATIYCLIFGLTPIYAPRYLFPIYIIFAMKLSGKKKIKDAFMEMPVSPKNREVQGRG